MRSFFVLSTWFDLDPARLCRDRLELDESVKIWVHYIESMLLFDSFYFVIGYYPGIINICISRVNM